MSMPFPHGTFFGVFEHDPNAFEGQGGMRKLEGEWTLDNGRWIFTIIDEFNLPTSIKGNGETPRDAVLDCLNVWQFMNGGEDSDLVLAFKRQLDENFKDTGYPIDNMLSEES